MPELTSACEKSKLYKENIAEIQTKDGEKITDVLQWLKNDLGILEENDYFVTNIMNLKKMNKQKTQKFLLKYFKARSKDGFYEIFSHRNVESDEILKSCQSVYYFCLPNTTKDGFRVVYIKLLPGIEPENFDPKAFFKRFFMVSDIRFKEEAPSKGDVVLLDMDGFTTQHAMKLFNSGLLQKFVKCLKESYPFRLESLYLMNMKRWHKRALMLCLKVTGAGRSSVRKVVAQPGVAATIDGVSTTMDSWTANLQDFNDMWTQKLISYGPWFESQDARYDSISLRSLHVHKEHSRTERDDKFKDSIHSEIKMLESLEGVFRKIDLYD